MDDPEEEIFEILRRDWSTFLVFQVSFVRVSMAYDEDSMYDEVPVSLTIYPEATIFSTLDPQSMTFLAILTAVFVVGCFLSVSYKCILPEHIRRKVIGFRNESDRAELEE